MSNMECNQERALRAKNLAEERILLQDFFQAQKFVHRAEHLYPDLPGLAQMRAIVDIHCNASRKPCQKDSDPLWHDIFEVKQCTDREAIKKHYRKLLLLLHPDKNKYPGAASAFELLTNAWNDYLECIHEGEVTKNTEDVAHSSEVFSTVSTPKSSPFVDIMCENPSKHSKYFQVNNANNIASCMLCIHPFEERQPKRNACKKHDSKNMTNINDADADSENEADIIDVEGMAKSHTHSVDADSENEADIIEVEGMAKSHTNSMRKRSRKAASDYTSNNVHHESSKRESYENGKVNKKRPAYLNRNEDFIKEMRKASAAVVEDYNNIQIKGIMPENANCSLRIDTMWASCGPRSKRKRKAVNSPSEPTCKRKTSDLQGTNILKDDNASVEHKFFKRVRSYILHGLRRINVCDISIMQQTRDQKDDVLKEQEESNVVVHLNLAIKFTVPSSKRHANVPKNENSTSSIQCKEDFVTKTKSKASTSDVYDFNKDRQEECFQTGQIWALYDDNDKLPRYYARVVEVLSKHPFKVHIKRLFPSRSISDGMKSWIDSGLAYTCGEFKVGRVLTKNSTSIFSHEVKFEKTKRPIKIYPRKGDVWALYKVWKPIKGATRECEPVEVMSEYMEDGEEGAIKVAPLFRVKGFKSIFCRAGSEVCEFISKAELTRFSHQVPAHHLQGYEVPSLPNNCFDLDTAALSLN